MVKLGEVCEINPRASKMLAASDEVSFVPMQGISEISKSIVSEEIKPYADVAKGYTPFENGDVLLAKITPCFENGKLAVAEIKEKYGMGSSEFHVFRIRDPRHLLNTYLYYSLQPKPFMDEAARNMTGSAGQKRVPKKYLEEKMIPLPPWTNSAASWTCWTAPACSSTSAGSRRPSWTTWPGPSSTGCSETRSGTRRGGR
jgi:type I restriction enzyme S subunit